MLVLRPSAHALPTALAVALTAAPACSRQIEEDPPIPEHRLEPCERWCAMIFDPVCPPREASVPSEEECIESCTTNEEIWAPVGGRDECEPTYVPLVECLASLPCDELQQHFALVNVVPPEEWSSCGELAQAQLDCQSAHY